MFSTAERLKERQGRHGTPRFDYLQELVTEFQSTSDDASKRQIVANLANFAYDPINYEALRKLHVVDLFVDMLSEPCASLVEFGMAGICNCCADPKNADIIVANDGVDWVIRCLSESSNTLTTQSALASLFFLCSHRAARAKILEPAVLDILRVFAASPQREVANLAQCVLDKLAVPSGVAHAHGHDVQGGAPTHEAALG
eukprot:jgi/Mesvir1/10672/Mv13764-RA.1